jgi:hypothetical protein
VYFFFFLSSGALKMGLKNSLLDFGPHGPNDNHLLFSLQHPNRLGLA